MEKITLNDIGTSLQITVTENDVAVDISTATAMSIILKKPDGTTAEKTGSFLTDGTDGVVKYSTLSVDIDQLGLWEYRAKITFSATQINYSIPDQFEVIK